MSKLGEHLPYRPCVGMMVLDKKGRAFVGKRIDQTIEAWQMPQGGIDEGEDAREAVMRELAEEIGTKDIEFLREYPGWLYYDLPEHLIGVALHGKFRGQKQRWFALRFLGQDSDIRIDTQHPEFSDWKWLGMDELLRVIVPFKREIYGKVIAAFSDLASAS
jgi:putative (di)nucleoside polyphosphate hydrolase